MSILHRGSQVLVKTIIPMFFLAALICQVIAVSTTKVVTTWWEIQYPHTPGHIPTHSPIEDSGTSSVLNSRV